ncbi:MAG: hypothetical protein WB784_07460 [Rhodanobacteraceae bacterium]
MSAPNNQLAPLIVGVTSHRNLADAEIGSLRDRVHAFLVDLGQRFPELPLIVLSALAEGGDRLVAEEALACGAELVAILPLPPALYANDFSDAASRAQFEQLCRRAEVVQVPLLARNTAAGIAVRGEQRDAQYAEAGLFIASHCHILLALWDGRTSDLMGGTAQIVRYYLDGIVPGAIERRRGTHSLIERDDESLLYHIACSRTGSDGGVGLPEPPLQPLEARWISQTGAQPAAAGIPAGFTMMFRRMVQFNADVERYDEDINAYASAATPGVDADANDRLDVLFAAADWLAMHFQKRVLLAMRGIHVLAALMGIAFVAYSDMPGDLVPQTPMLDLFIALFAAGVLLDRMARRRHWHRKYIDYRALAEGLRVQRYWQRAGVAAATSIAFAHDNFMQKQDLELGWIRNVMRAAGLNAPDCIDVSPAALAAVIEDWIGTPGRSGQLDYYTRRTKQRSRVHRATHGIGRICLWIGIAIGATLAIFHRQLDADISNWLVAAMGVLAIIAAARESYAYRKADKELIKQYQFMRNIFAGARTVLDAEPDVQGKRDILRALGEAALAEHAEWALMHRERPLEHGKL